VCLESDSIPLTPTGERRGAHAGCATGDDEEGRPTLHDTAYELPTWAALPARPDPGFDELAARVAAELRAPRALVVLTSKGGQVFPGAFGLPEPWESRRSLPLTHSMSLRSVATGRPLVLRDAREDPELGTGPAVRELSVVGYAAMPLLDVHGRPIGVLAVSDPQPRDWTAGDLDALRRLAAEASRRLQVQVLELAEREARAAAERDEDAAAKAAAAGRAALAEAEAAADRTRVVARLSSELLPVQTLPEVLRAVDRFIRSPLGATSTLLGLAENGCTDVQVWVIAAGAAPSTRPLDGLQVSSPHPLAVALRERRLVPVASRAEDAAPGPELPVPWVETSLAVPLTLGQHTAAGGLLVGWGHHRELDTPMRTVVTDLARHVGHAVDRVLLRELRRELRAADGGPEPVRA